MDASKRIAAVNHLKGMVDGVKETWAIKFGITLSTAEEKNEHGQCLNLIADWHPILPTEQVQIRLDVMDAIDTQGWGGIVAKAFELLMEKVQKERLKHFKMNQNQKESKVMAKKKTKRQKFIIRDKANKEPICGVRYDKEENEFLIGGPKTKAEERDKLILMLDLDTEEIEKEVKEDGFRSRIRVAVDEPTWEDFCRRASRLYIFEEVKSFKRLMN